MPRCKYCDEYFKSNAGLKQHITKMHTSESLFGNKYIDPMKIDPFGAATKRMMREQNKKK